VTIQNLISTANHDLKLAISNKIDEELLMSITTLLEKGVAVTLALNSETEASLRDDVFLFNKCLVVQKKGGEIYFHHSLSETLAVSDYKVGFVDSKEGDAHQALRKFKALEKEFKPFITDDNDIKLSFKATDDIILKGDEITISWEAHNAETVIIQGIGEVEPVGKKKIRPANDTIFKIGAYNSSQSRLKTIGVKVFEDILIDYDLSFANPRTKEFSSLVKEENYPHVFGVARDNIVRLNWRVKDANDVVVKPFDIKEPAGEHEFVPKANMVIEIQAEVLGRTLKRKIQLLVFPIRLFKEKVATISADLHQNLLKNTPDTTELVQNIKERQTVYSQSLKKIRQIEERKSKLLLKQIRQITFDNSDNKYNLDRINSRVFDRLRAYYSKKPGIVEVIESIKSYYDRVQKGNRTN